MRSVLIFLLSISFLSEAQISVIATTSNNKLAGDVTLESTYIVGFKTQLDWTGTGSFTLEKSFNSDYSDAETIYSGSLNTYTDETSVVGGYCYYRVKKGAGSWVNEIFDGTISDATNGTRTCIYGNSIVNGDNASPLTLGFAKNWYNVRGWAAYLTGDIIGLGGYSLTPEATPGNVWDYTTGLWEMPSKVDARNFCFMTYGINDAANAGVDAAEYQVAVEDWIDYAISIGWPVNRIIITGPWYNPANVTKGHQLKNAAKAAAASRGAGFLSVMDWQIANSVIPADNFHPSTEQHRLADLWLCKHVGNDGDKPIAPVLSSIQVTGTTSITVVFTSPVNATNVGWTFKKNAGANNPTSVSGDGTSTLIFTVPTIAAGDVVTYSYSQSTGDAIGVQYSYSLEYGDQTDQTVTNTLVAYDSDYQAVLDRAAVLGYTTPDVTTQGYQNQFVLDLKSAGIWTKLDVLYVLTSGSAEFARINWKAPSSNLITAVSSPTWTSGVGYGGNGTSSYLNTNWKPSDGTNYVQNNASIFCYIQNHVTENKFDLGSAMNFIGGSNVAVFRADDGFGSTVGYINQSGSAVVANGGNCVGLWQLQRKDASNNYIFKNGTQVDTEADVSTGVSNINMYALAYNGGGTAAGFSTRKISLIGSGDSLNGLESALNTAWSTYKTSIGL